MSLFPPGCLLFPSICKPAIVESHLVLGIPSCRENGEWIQRSLPAPTFLRSAEDSCLVCFLLYWFNQERAGRIPSKGQGIFQVIYLLIQGFMPIFLPTGHPKLLVRLFSPSSILPSPQEQPCGVGWDESKWLAWFPTRVSPQSSLATSVFSS